MNPSASGHLAMLTFSAVVAGSFSLGGMMANEIDPAAFTAVRFCFATVFLAILVQLRGGFATGSFASPWRYGVLGGLYAFYFVLMFEGLKTAPPVSAAAVFTLVPLMAAGFAWLLLRQIMTRRIALALAIGAIGAVWVIFRADLGAVMSFQVGQGEAIYFIGCVSHALYTPMVRRLNRGEAVVTFAFGTSLAGGVLLLLYAGAEILAIDWGRVSSLVWITLLYTSFFATAGSVMLLQFATLRLPSAKVMAYTYLVPTWVILWEIGLGNALPPVLILGGVALTVVALLLLLREEGG